MEFTICIVGLGLMGSSLAQALKGFKNAKLVGVDEDPAVCNTAQESGVATKCWQSVADGAKNADLIIFCVYAHHIPALVAQCLPVLKNGAVLCDICGVKNKLYHNILPQLPDGISYVGLHPMAGKEKDGIANADKNLFKNTSFLVCPTEKTTQNSLILVKELAAHIGCAKIEEVAFAMHDEIIAYTSDLMHIASAGLCLNYHQKMSSAFTAGAFRDCTRIADINPSAWCELLLDNKANVSHFLGQYIDDLSSIHAAIQENNPQELHRLLKRAGDNKREMLTR